MRRRKKKMFGILLLKKFGVESPTREKPKSGVLEKILIFEEVMIYFLKIGEYGRTYGHVPTRGYNFLGFFY